MEDKVYSAMYVGNRLCDKCIHNYINNDEGVSGCRAFPNGIPDIAQYGHAHHEIIEGQEGSYIYRKARYDELSQFAKFIHAKYKENW